MVSSDIIQDVRNSCLTAVNNNFVPVKQMLINVASRRAAREIRHLAYVEAPCFFLLLKTHTTAVALAIDWVESLLILVNKANVLPTRSLCVAMKALKSNKKGFFY